MADVHRKPFSPGKNNSRDFLQMIPPQQPVDLMLTALSKLTYWIPLLRRVVLWSVCFSETALTDYLCSPFFSPWGKSVLNQDKCLKVTMMLWWSCGSKQVLWLYCIILLLGPTCLFRTHARSKLVKRIYVPLCISLQDSCGPTRVKDTCMRMQRHDLPFHLTDICSNAAKPFVLMLQSSRALVKIKTRLNSIKNCITYLHMCPCQRDSTAGICHTHNQHSVAWATAVYNIILLEHCLMYHPPKR